MIIKLLNLIIIIERAIGISWIPQSELQEDLNEYVETTTPQSETEEENTYILADESINIYPDPNEWLTAHNIRRARHCNTSSLIWSDVLQTSAQQWAQNCEFKRSNLGGENIYMVFGQNTEVSAEGVLQQFYDNQIIYYDFSDPGFSPLTGSFSQIVWQSSAELGCAVQECVNFKLVVCHYSPKGNVAGRFDMEVAPVCESG